MKTHPCPNPIVTTPSWDSHYMKHDKLENDKSVCQLKQHMLIRNVRSDAILDSSHQADIRVSIPDISKELCKKLS